MKTLKISIAVLFLSLTAATAQTTSNNTPFNKQVQLMEYSNKFCNDDNLKSLYLMQTSTERISFDWLLGAIKECKGLRTEYAFSILAQTNEAKANPTLLSSVIAQYKAFQNDYCYYAYLSLKPSKLDIDWLKLQVNDTTLSNLFATR